MNPKPLSELLKAFTPPEGFKFPPEKVRCVKCHDEFISNGGWLINKWQYANVCDWCGRYGPFSRQFWRGILPPREMLTENCPECGYPVGAEPYFDYPVWYYRFVCPHDGQEWSSCRHPKRKCDGCGKVFILKLEPYTRCQDCREEELAKGPARKVKTPYAE
jgi:hypothetical protein